MSDIERRLQELSARAREKTPALFPDDCVLRRIRWRRGVSALAAALALVSVIAGGVYASSTLLENDPTMPAPAPSGGRCGAPLEFEATYVPPGFSEDPILPPHSVAPRAGDEVARYDGPQQGMFITLRRAPVPGLARVRRQELWVLGRSAELAAIHEGFLVSFRYQDCYYEAHAYGVKRFELRWFAEGLQPRSFTMKFTPIESPSPPEQAKFTGAVWPEDTEAAAESACSTYQDWRADGVSVALEFARDVLEWSAPASFDVHGSVVEIRRSGSHDGNGVRGVVRVFTTQVSPGCWSVASVGRPPDRRPTGVSVSVSGRLVEIGFDPRGAARVRVEIGYHGRIKSQEIEAAARRAVFGIEFEPDTRGHYLILLKDERGRVFSATGAPLPPGDFAAG